MLDIAPSDIRQLAHRHAIACVQYAATRTAMAHKVASKSPKAHMGGQRGGGRPPVLTMRILNHLAANGPATAEQIALALGLDKMRIRWRCKQLFALGRLVHAVEGRGNRPCVYALAERAR